MTPRCDGCAAGDPRYLPTFGGTSQVFLVRSGLIAVHPLPPLVVFHSVFDAK